MSFYFSTATYAHLALCAYVAWRMCFFLELQLFIVSFRVNNKLREAVQYASNCHLISSCDSKVSKCHLEGIIEIGEDVLGDWHSGVNHPHVAVSSVGWEILITTKGTTEKKQPNFRLSYCIH